MTVNSQSKPTNTIQSCAVNSIPQRRAKLNVYSYNWSIVSAEEKALMQKAANNGIGKREQLPLQALVVVAMLAAAVHEAVVGRAGEAVYDGVISKLAPTGVVIT